MRPANDFHGSFCLSNGADWKRRRQPILGQPQELFRGRVCETKSARVQTESIRIEFRPATRDQALHFIGPTFAEVEAGDLPKLLKAPADVHAQSERCRFASARLG